MREGGREERVGGEKGGKHVHVHVYVHIHVEV